MPRYIFHTEFNTLAKNCNKSVKTSLALCFIYCITANHFKQTSFISCWSVPKILVIIWVLPISSSQTTALRQYGEQSAQQAHNQKTGPTQDMKLQQHKIIQIPPLPPPQNKTKTKKKPVVNGQIINKYLFHCNVY